MLSSRSHDRVPQLAVLLAIGLTALVLLSRIAHAAVGPAEAVPALGIDWTFWIAVVGLVLGTASAALHVIAPRTKTTIDDRWRDDVDAVLRWWKDRSTPAALLVVLLLGATGAGLTSCASARPALAAGAVAMLVCEDGHLDALALADAKLFAAAEVEHWLAGGAAPSPSALLADLAPIKSDLGRCAIAAALAAATVLVRPATPGTATSALVAGPDPVQVRGAFAVAARQLGWAPVKVAGGQVL